MRALENDPCKFILYDAGESFTKKGICKEEARAEHAAFIYRFVPAHMGKMRKMDILIPTIKKSSFGISKLAMGQNEEDDEDNSQSQNSKSKKKGSRPGADLNQSSNKPITDIGQANIFNLDGNAEVNEKEVLDHLKKERTTVYSQIANKPMNE